MSKLNEQHNKRLWNKLLTFIKDRPINTVSFIPPLTAAFLVVTWAIIKDRFLPDSPQIYNYIVLSTASIIIGSVGLVYVYRKEMPGPISSTTIKGGVAIATGIALLLFFCGLGVLGLILAILEN